MTSFSLDFSALTVGPGIPSGFTWLRNPGSEVVEVLEDAAYLDGKAIRVYHTGNDDWRALGIDAVDIPAGDDFDIVWRVRNISGYSGSSQWAEGMFARFDPAAGTSGRFLGGYGYTNSTITMARSGETSSNWSHIAGSDFSAHDRNGGTTDWHWFRFRAVGGRYKLVSSRSEADIMLDGNGEPVVGWDADVAYAWDPSVSSAVGFTFWRDQSRADNVYDYIEVAWGTGNYASPPMSEPPWTIETTVIGGGSIQLDPDQVDYADQTVVEVTAIPDPGFVFVEWSGDLSGGDTTKFLTMDSDKSITASFSDESVHLYDFGEDTVGVLPSYMAEAWEPAGITVIESTWADNGRALQIPSYASNSFRGAVFSELGELGDVEVFARMREIGTRSDSHWGSGIIARVSGAAGNENAHLVFSRNTTSNLQVARLNGGAFDWSEFTGINDTAFFLRVRFVGDTATGRIWADGTAEPATWQFEDHIYPSPTFATGTVGVGRFFQSTTTEIDYIQIQPLGAEEPPAELRIMATGDSITRGMGDDSQNKYTYRWFLHQHLVAQSVDFDMVGPFVDGSTDLGTWDRDHYGVGGWTIGQVANDIAARVTTYEPDILTVMIGINDIGSSGTPDIAQMIVSYEALIDNARSAKADVKMLVARIPPRALSRDVYVDDFNDQLVALVQSKTTEVSPLYIVDANLGFINATHNYDDLHPNILGEERQAIRFVDGLFEYFAIGAYYESPATLTLVEQDGVLSWGADPERADVYDIEHDASVATSVSDPTYDTAGTAGTYRVRGRRLV